MEVKKRKVIKTRKNPEPLKFKLKYISAREYHLNRSKAWGYLIK